MTAVNMNDLAKRKEELQDNLQDIKQEMSQLQQRLNLLAVDEQRIGGALALIQEIEATAQKGDDEASEE